MHSLFSTKAKVDKGWSFQQAVLKQLCVTCKNKKQNTFDLYLLPYVKIKMDESPKGKT